MTAASCLQVRSPAKLNWTLDILGRRRDGFHELRSWFVAIGLYDTLTVTVQAHSGALQVTGSMAAAIPRDAKNLVLAAESMWRAAGGEAPPVAWRLQKEIPVAAGLGGGSGNAAAALLLLEALASRASTVDCAALALRLGSDVPFFLQDAGACMMGGRGECRLQSCEPPSRSVVLAVPDFPVSTAQVFAVLKAPNLPQSEDRDFMAEQPVDQEGGRTHSFPAVPGANALWSAAQRAVPELAVLAKSLSAVAPFQLSGSGGAFFCPVADPLSATEIAAHAQEVCQHVWVVPLVAGPVISVPQTVEKG